MVNEQAAAEGRWNLPTGMEEAGVGRGSKEVKALGDGCVEGGCEQCGGRFPDEVCTMFCQCLQIQLGKSFPFDP